MPGLRKYHPIGAKPLGDLSVSGLCGTTPQSPLAVWEQIAKLGRSGMFSNCQSVSAKLGRSTSLELV
jgi:hypothetical protein